VCYVSQGEAKRLPGGGLEVLEAEDILNGIVRGALGGRRKSWRRAGRAVGGGGLINANTLLAAAGVA
jgi:hypothetical protein